MNTTALPTWFEVLKMVPGIITACTAIYGLTIAKAGLEKWRKEIIGKRKTELAEEVLADFYQARDRINAARSPAGYSNEGNSRQKADWETEADTSNLNAYFAVIERLTRGDFFAQLHARRYRFQAYFGKEATKPYDDLHQIHSEIVVAVRMLITTYNARRTRRGDQDDKWEKVIWWGSSEDDAIPSRLDSIVTAIEKTCQPIIQEAA